MSKQEFDFRKINNEDVNNECIFRQYNKLFVSYAYRFVDEVQIAENVVYDVFVQMWQLKHDIDFGANIKTYLFNGTRNNCL